MLKLIAVRMLLRDCLILYVARSGTRYNFLSFWWLRWPSFRIRNIAILCWWNESFLDNKDSWLLFTTVHWLLNQVHFKYSFFKSRPAVSGSKNQMLKSKKWTTLDIIQMQYLNWCYCLKDYHRTYIIFHFDYELWMNEY